MYPQWIRCLFKSESAFPWLPGTIALVGLPTFTTIGPLAGLPSVMYWRLVQTGSRQISRVCQFGGNIGNIYRSSTVETCWNQFFCWKIRCFFTSQHVFPDFCRGPSASGWNLMMARRMRRMSRGSCVGSPSGSPGSLSSLWGPDAWTSWTDDCLYCKRYLIILIGPSGWWIEMIKD